MLPSGEMLGPSWSRDEVTSFRASGGDACKSNRQIFMLPAPCAYASPGPADFAARSEASWPTGSISMWLGRESEVSQSSPKLDSEPKTILRSSLDSELKTIRRSSLDHAKPPIKSA